MGGGDPSEAAKYGDAVRRRRLKFRAWHRGMREVDLILGRFADASVEGMDEAELSAFEALLDEADPEILSWVTGQTPVPDDGKNKLVHQLIAFCR